MPSKKEESDRETPVFLAKTYKMVDEGVHDVVGWTPDGNSFIIKDCDRFTEEVIPKYFKHKNFSSFVRQLNFYGFRKVKDGRPRGASKDKQKPKWEFHHPNFRQGQRDLLKDIKRRSYQDAAHSGPNKGDVDKLRDELAALRKQMVDLSGSMQSLVNTVQSLQEEMQGGKAPVQVEPMQSQAAQTSDADRPEWVPELENQNFESVEGELNAFYETDAVSLDLPQLSRITSLDASFEGLGERVPQSGSMERPQPECEGMDTRIKQDLEVGTIPDGRKLGGALGPLGGLLAAGMDDAVELSSVRPSTPERLPSKKAIPLKASLPRRPTSSPQVKSESDRDVYARLESLTQEEQNRLIDRMAKLILRSSGIEDQEKQLNAAEAATFASGAQAPNVEESIGLRLPCGFDEAMREQCDGDELGRTPVDMALILPISAGAADDEV